MKKQILTTTALVLIALAIMPMTLGLTLSPTTTLNATLTNASVTVISQSIVVDAAVVTDYGVELHNVSYTNGELTITYTEIVNHTTANTNVDTANFIRITSSSDESKTFSSSLLDYNAEVTFNVNNCENIGKITHVGSAGSVEYYSSDYTCSSNQVTLTLTDVGDGDTLAIEYACSRFTILGYRLIILLSALAIISFIAYTVYKEGLNGLTLGKIIVLAVTIIVAVVMWVATGQQASASCGVIHT